VIRSKTAVIERIGGEAKEDGQKSKTAGRRTEEK
jgi:hypothetical protein